MRIIISNSSGIPIYEQIKNSIINQILNNELQENEMLPSIRILAQDINISFLTVKKAYDDLEKDGYIITRQGKGSFIAPKNLELVKEQKQKEIEEHLIKVVELSKNYEISKKEILSLFEYIYRSDER